MALLEAREEPLEGAACLGHVLPLEVVDWRRLLTLPYSRAISGSLTPPFSLSSSFHASTPNIRWVARTIWVAIPIPTVKEWRSIPLLQSLPLSKVSWSSNMLFRRSAITTRHLSSCLPGVLEVYSTPTIPAITFSLNYDRSLCGSELLGTAIALSSRQNISLFDRPMTALELP